MKVKGVVGGKVERLTSRGGAGSSRMRVTSGPAGSLKDDVAVSPEGRLIGMAGEAVQAAPDLREERIQPIAEALAAGRYDVSSLEVADKILRQVLRDRRRMP